METATYIKIDGNHQIELEIKNCNDTLYQLKTCVKLPYVCPEIANYPYYTAILGILTGNNCETNWIYNNHILLWCFEKMDAEPYWTDFKYGDDEIMEELCPCLNKRILLRKTVSEQYASVIDCLEELVKEKNYIFLSVDIFHIPQWWQVGVQHEHIKHQMLICGVDRECQKVYAADFYQGQYSVSAIDFKDFEAAYNDFDRVNDSDVNHCCNLELLSLKTTDYAIDSKRIQGLIEDMISSTDRTVRNRLNNEPEGAVIYGFEFFNHMVRYLKRQIKQQTYIDYRGFYVIKQENSIMIKRIDFFGIEDVKLHTMLQEAILLCDKMIGYILKYNFTLHEKSAQRVLEHMQELIPIEKQIFYRVQELFNERVN